MENQFHQLRFDISEKVRLNPQQLGISDLLGLDLYPDVEIKSEGEHLRIQGYLRLNGTYQSEVTDIHLHSEHEGEVANPQDIAYVIPVEITLPAERAQLDQISAEIEAFDYQLLSPFELQIEATLMIDGILPEQKNEEQVHATEAEGARVWTTDTGTPWIGAEAEATKQWADWAGTEASKQWGTRIHATETGTPDVGAYDWDKYAKEMERYQAEWSKYTSEVNKTDWNNPATPESWTEQWSHYTNPFQPNISNQGQPEAWNPYFQQEQQPTEQSIPSASENPLERHLCVEEETVQPVYQQESYPERANETWTEHQVSRKEHHPSYLSQQEREELFQVDPIPQAEASQGVDWIRWLVRGKPENFTSMKMVIVQRDESLDQLAQRYAVSADRLLRLNKLHTDRIEEGQIIHVPQRA